MNVTVDAIPKELRDRPQWVCWRYENRDGQPKPTKVPINVQTGRRASSTDAKTWSTFNAALDRLSAGDVDGIGYVFNDDHVGIDLDNAIDPAGELKPWASEIVKECPTYTERSPSKTGIHLITAGSLPPHWTGTKRPYHDGAMEIYSRGRFFTVTGDSINGHHNGLHDYSAVIQGFYKRIGGPVPNGNSRPEPEACTINVTDNEIFDAAFNARNGDKFRRLWNGDFSDYPSQSEADQALANFLAFYTGKDAGRIDSFFRQSGLMRPKWERADYRDRTIAAAIVSTTEIWKQRRNGTRTPKRRMSPDREPPPPAETGPDGVAPIIRVSGGSLPENFAAAESYLAAATRRNPAQGIYQRAGVLVRIVSLPIATVTDGIRRAAGTLQILPAGPDILRLKLTEATNWERYDRKARAWIATDAPTIVARTLCDATGLWTATPVLNGITEAPTLRPDGTVLDRAGYDPGSGLYFDPGLTKFDIVPDHPTKKDAIVALNHLLTILKDFPFLDDASRSVAVAFLMTPHVRHAVRAAPLTAITAPKMASGKTLLAHLAAYIANGRQPSLITQAEKAEEERKRLLALLLEGSVVTVIDNCERPLKSDALCTALTEAIIRDRLLGLNKTVSVPTSTTWAATGNNLHIEGDLSSRALLCTLDPECERPEERKFSVNLHEYVPSRRGELVAAVLTVVRAYIVAGFPCSAVPIFGRFEDWSRYVREPLVWLGLTDPCQTRHAIEARDPVRDELGDLLESWHGAFRDKPQTLAAVVAGFDRSSQLSDDLQSLRNSILAIAEDKQRINSRRLGNFLSNHERRIERGLRFEKAGTRKNAVLWRVTKSG